MPTRADYAKIHIAKKALGMDDDQYRDMLQERYQVRSSRELKPGQVSDLLVHCRRLGVTFKRKVKQGKGQTTKRGRNYIKIKPGPAAKQQRKVLAMWNALGYDVDKLHARVKKQFGVDRFEWLDDHHDLHVLITDLGKRLDAAGLRKA
jgi:phage gp16-like protein